MNYPTLKAALDSLNLYGVSGNVVVNVPAGYTETAPSGGLYLGSLVLNASLNTSSTLTIQKSGTGANPLITAYTGGAFNPATATQDGIFRLVGTDYVTIDAIDLTENAANTAGTSRMEYGYALYKLSSSDGAQHNIIRNCAITLSRTNMSSFAEPAFDGAIGILTNNSTPTATTTAIIPASRQGTNSYNAFYNNTIQNCNYGIVLSGYVDATPYLLADTLNDVGGNSAPTGNTFLNFGGGATFGLNAAAGVCASAQYGFNASYNTINNNNGSGVNHNNPLKGIWIKSAVNSSVSITYNTITVKGGGSTQQVAAIEHTIGGTAADNTVDISYNNILKCTYGTATTGNIYGIYSEGGVAEFNITNNVLDSLTRKDNGSSGHIIGFYINGNITTLNVNKNYVRGIAFSTVGSSSVTLNAILVMGNVSTAIFLENRVTNYKGGSSFNGANRVIGCLATSALQVFKHNTIDSITGGGDFWGIQVGSGLEIICDSNTIFHLSNGTTTAGIFIESTTPVKESYSFNRIYDIKGTLAAAGIRTYSTPHPTKKTIANNLIYDIQGGNATGILQTAGGSRIYNNRIYGIKGTSTISSVNGILLESSYTGDTVFVYNNLIAGLTAPQSTTSSVSATADPVIKGIYSRVGQTNAVTYLYHNTIYFGATSTGAHFPTVGIYHYNSVLPICKLDMRNNIVINLSSPIGLGKAVGFRTDPSTLSSVLSSSNNNLWCVGNPSSPFQVVYFDGLNVDQTLADFKARMSPRESNSISELPVFLSTDILSPDFLKIDSATETNIEAGASVIPGFPIDHYNTIRAENPGYTGTSAMPDIGALEGEYKAPASKGMVHVSSAAQQGSFYGLPGAQEAKILRIRIQSNNAYKALEATAFKLQTAGTTNKPAILNAKLYYTGNDSLFSASTLFGSIIPAPGDTFYITGSQKLKVGANYFWLTYDLNASATIPDEFDAVLDSITLTDSLYSPVIGNPPGVFRMSTLLNGPYTVGNGHDFPSITYAFDALNNLGVSGPVTFILKDTLYTESTGERFPLNLLEYPGGSALNTVKLICDSGVISVIKGSSRFSIMDFNGGSNITIDGILRDSSGVVTGGKLSIVNTNKNATAMRFVNDAGFNHIMHCDLRSDNMNEAQNPDAGVIFFGGTTKLNGNDSNRIDHCNIHGFAGHPATGISSVGAIEGNDVNTIDSCNIYDFFSDSLSSTGIHLGLNNNMWQLTGNHLYQQDTLVYTRTGLLVALYHRGVWCNKTGKGHLISGNMIGGNDASGNGMYAVTGIGALNFTGIELGVSAQDPVSVQDNTITNLYLGDAPESMVFEGIDVTDGNADIGTINGNLIGSRTVNGSIAFKTNGYSVIEPIMISKGLTVNIENNIISGIDIHTYKGIGFEGITATNFGKVRIANNIIGDPLLSNSIRHISHDTTQTNSTIWGVSSAGFSFNPPMDSMSVINNTFSNISSAPVNPGSNYKLSMGGMTLSASSFNTRYIISGNDIYNLSTASKGTSYNVITGIDYATTAGTGVIKNNTIHSLILTNKTTLSTNSIVGIHSLTQGFAAVSEVSNNFIHSFSPDTSNTELSILGIFLEGANNTTNNIIRLGVEPSGSSVATRCKISGISMTSNAIGTIGFNTVYIGGTAGPATNLKRTFAFERVAPSTTTTTLVRNNVFVNQRTNATGGFGHFAVYAGNNSYLQMDYNLLYADSMGIYNTTAVGNNLTQWKRSANADSNSISAWPGFINATGDTGSLDLHINASTPTPVEAQGNMGSLTLATDIDNETRSSLTPVDMGADAGNFTALDASPPVIALDPLKATPFLTDRVFSVNITDASGVYLSDSLKPRVYFKKSFAGTYQFTKGVLTSGTAGSGTWEFTINASMIGGLAIADTVYYFLVAQDSTLMKNFASVPLGAEGINADSITVKPVPYKYHVTPYLNGTINVGNGQTYQTLTGTSGLFAEMNRSYVGSNLSVKITSDILEPGTVALNEITETGSGGYTVTIGPDTAVLRSVTGNYAGSAINGMIRLDGADRIKIDGSYNGNGRYLRILNRATTSPTIQLLNDAHRDTIANTIIEGVSTTAGTILFGAGKIGGSGNDSNAVTYCLIKDTTGTSTTGIKPGVAILSTISGGGLENSHNAISFNEIFNFKTAGIRLPASGLFVADNWQIDHNAFYQDSTRGGATHYAIEIRTGGYHRISKNSIGGQSSSRSGKCYTVNAASFYGIYVNTGLASPSVIDSNTISNLSISNATSATYLVAISAVASTSASITGNTIGGGANSYDTLSSGYFIHGIEASGTYSVVSINGNMIGNFTNYGKTSNTRAVSGISLNVNIGQATISNNVIRDLRANSTAASSTIPLVGLGPIGIVSDPVTGNVIVENNLIYNIDGQKGLTATGMIIGSNISATSLVRRNRIYNIFTDSVSPLSTAFGIISMGIGNNNNTFENNQISLGGSTSCRMFGIYDSKTKGTNTYQFNTIAIQGTAALTVTGNHYTFYQASMDTVVLKNNLFYNSRSNASLSGISYAIGKTNNSPLIENTAYNLMVVNDTAQLIQLPYGTKGWQELDSFYTNSYNTNWVEKTSVLSAGNLFINAPTGDLGINTSNPESWYANGKGIAIAGVSGDYNNTTGVRSEAITTGAVDLGSVEFTPAPGVLPGTAYASKTPMKNDSTVYFYAGRKIAKILWDTTGTLPAGVDLRYYSGTNPPGTLPGSTYMNAYWGFTTTTGSSYNYGLQLVCDSAVMGTVSNPSQLSMARHIDLTNWHLYDSTTTGSPFFEIASAGLDHIGVFTGTDKTNNPLPVSLMDFAVKEKGNDVWVSWTTLSEQNTKGFEVERSFDGKSFEFVGFIKGKGFSSSKNQYGYNDKNAFGITHTNRLYYRLKSADYDGSYSYSDIAIAERNTHIPDAAVNIFPNPAGNEITIEGMQQDAILKDLLGNTVMNIAHDGKIDISRLRPGIYFLQTGTIVQKIIKY